MFHSSFLSNSSPVAHEHSTSTIKGGTSGGGGPGGDAPTFSRHLTNLRLGYQLETSLHEYEEEHDNASAAGLIRLLSAASINPPDPAPAPKPRPTFRLDRRNMEHRLSFRWTLWLFRFDRQNRWEANQRPICSVATVESFWRLYNNVENASKLIQGCEYSFFKSGIKPMWEDPRNRRGGRWQLRVDKRHRATDLDNLWLETLLALIGQVAFGQNTSAVNGAVLACRPRQDRIGLWLNNAEAEDVVMSTGKALKETLRLDHSVSIAFEVHDESKRKSSSTGVQRYVM